jgi:hypothetical protein
MQVTYTARSMRNTSVFSSCTFDITILGTHLCISTQVPQLSQRIVTFVCLCFVDSEFPVVSNCPASGFTVCTDAGLLTRNFTWIEPSATDNIAVSSMASVVLRSHLIIHSSIMRWEIFVCFLYFYASAHMQIFRPPANLRLGTTSVQYNFSDAAGNLAFCTFDVTV